MARAPVDGAEWFGLGPHRVLPRQPPRGTHRPFLLRRRRPLRRLRAAPGDRAPFALRRLELTSAGAGVLRFGPSRTCAGRLPRLHAQPPHPAADRPGGPPVRAAGVDDESSFVDAAQHGLGSRACGPDVWPEFALRPRPGRSGCASQQASHAVRRTSAAPPGSRPSHTPPAPRSRGGATPVLRWSGRPPSPAVDRDAHQDRHKPGAVSREGMTL